jgi:hypothetical protein
MKTIIPALLVGSIAGCTGKITAGGSDETGGARDITPPAIEIEMPQRGTIAEGTQVQVAGRVTDVESDIAQVTINGQPTAVGADGSFSLTLDASSDGITLLETIASDTAGNQASDARAVLTGTLVSHETPVAEGLAAHVSAQAMNGLSSMLSTTVNNVNFTSVAKSQNPVVDTGSSCNSAKVYVDSVGHGGINVDANPVTGGIKAGVSIRSLVVRGRVTFRAVCISGSANWTIRATSYDVGGRIAPTLNSAAINIGLDGITSQFRGFNLTISGVPGVVVDMVEGRVRDELAKILRDKIRQLLPPLANDFLAEFLADSWDVNLLGQTLNLSVWPSAMTWTAEGGTIVLDTSTTIDGMGDALYLSSPRPRPSTTDLTSTGFRVGVADDVLNQLLSAMWVTGSFEDQMVPVEDALLSAAFGGDVGSATLNALLPPVASFDTTTGTARLTIGDLMMTVLDPSGDTLAQFVISSEIDLAVETTADGRVKLVTRTPRILAQVLEQSPNLVTPLDGTKVTSIAELAVTQLSLMADELLDTLPVPGLADAAISSPTFQPANGYLLIGGQLSFR